MMGKAQGRARVLQVPGHQVGEAFEEESRSPGQARGAQPGEDGGLLTQQGSTSAAWWGRPRASGDLVMKTWRNILLEDSGGLRGEAVSANVRRHQGRR